MAMNTLLRLSCISLMIIICTASPSFEREPTPPLRHSVPRSERPSIGATFADEELNYRMSFWWFNHAADGRIAIKREEGGFLITLSAETTGFIGWVTRYRKDYYRTYVEEIEGGRRFRLKRFEKEVTIGKRVRKGITTMDYERRLMTWRSWGGGKEEKEGEDPIPEGAYYDDPLTAFYNFRYGVYGPIEEGGEYHITTFPKKGVSTIYLRLANHDEKMERIKRRRATDYLADIRINEELFGSQTGGIEALFTRELVPLEGVVKDVVFFGDVRGVLLEEGYLTDFKQSAYP